ncbi:MAG: thiamine pyrophosphate-binding protein [Candidatus Gastranaerophilales bacterium]|nr:thiamine pyrophosphate-binding protein [Candidatus Gastranaerophilales bacterium]
MKLTDYIVKFLKEQGINTVFGYTGGSIADLVDSIYKSDINFVQNRHEQASSFCANGYAEITQNFGVAISSSGPGACNLINGIANAYFDSVPCLFITGNVHSLAEKKSDKIRQNGFQETDIVPMVKGITKFAVKMKNAKDIAYLLEKAVYLAKEGRKGSVLIDIPYDIQRADIDEKSLEHFAAPEKENFDKTVIKDVVKLLSKAKKPVILVGGGAKYAKNEIAELIKKVKIPIVASLCGLDVLSHENDCFTGFIGTYGNKYANLALQNSDLILVLGSRLDERQIGYRRNEFAPKAKIIRVEIDPVEINRTVDETISVNADVKEFLQNLLRENLSDITYSDWFKTVNEWKNEFKNGKNVFGELSEYIPEKAVICSDVGIHQMYLARNLKIKNGQKLLNSAGFGSMGYSLPAAIGAYYADKNNCVVSVNGDGGIQMNLQELQTVSANNLPVHTVIINNKCLGMIRMLQENLFNDRYYASVDGFDAPDFEEIAKAYNLKYLKIEKVEDMNKTADIFNSDKPSIIELYIDYETLNNKEAD